MNINEKFLSKDDDYLSHIAWRTPLPSPTYPKGVAWNILYIYSPRTVHFLNSMKCIFVTQSLYIEQRIYLFCTAMCGIFYRTPAGYAADKKTRLKRNMGCYELLSASCHPSPPSNFPPPPHRASVAPPAATLSGLGGRGRPLPPHPPEDYSQLLAASAKIEDGLHLGACEYGSWIWTAIMIMYEFLVQW
jgi:hypothetical protein